MSSEFSCGLVPWKCLNERQATSKQFAVKLDLTYLGYYLLMITKNGNTKPNNRCGIIENNHLKHLPLRKPVANEL